MLLILFVGKTIMIHDEKAVIGLPIYLLIAIITSASIISIFTLATLNIFREGQIHQIEQEIDKIISEAENMFEYADSGSNITLNTRFPESMKFIVFGDLPENNNQPPTDLTLKENTCNNYYYVLNDGTITTQHTNVRFSGEQTNQIALLQAGEYNLKLELVKETTGKSYVKIFY